jgi:5-methylcytosine-specific restriction endonuclease McrA
MIQVFKKAGFMRSKIGERRPIDGSRDRFCVVCEKMYLAYSRVEISFLCPDCCTPKLRKEQNRYIAEMKRARQHNLPTTLVFKQWLRVLEYFNWSCAYCKEGNLDVMDHVISIKDNGGTEALNVVPCCYSCNNKDNGMISKEKRVSLDVINAVREELARLFAGHASPC